MTARRALVLLPLRHAYRMAVATSNALYVERSGEPCVWQGLTTSPARLSRLASVIAQTLGNLGRVALPWGMVLGMTRVVLTRTRTRPVIFRIQRRNTIKPEFTRTTGEFEMYRSSRRGVSEGRSSCTCQNGVTQTRVRGGTEIIRTISAGARASWTHAGAI